MLKNDAPSWLIDMVAKVIHDAEGMGNTVWPLNPESSSFFLTEEEKGLYHKAAKDVLESISSLDILDTSGEIINLLDSDPDTYKLTGSELGGAVIHLETLIDKFE